MSVGASPSRALPPPPSVVAKPGRSAAGHAGLTRRWPITRGSINLLPKCSIVLTFVAVLASTGVLSAASPPSSSTSFEVVIRHWVIDYGTWVYELRPSGLMVSLEDSEKHSRNELCRVNFTGNTAAEWAHVVSTLDVDRLVPNYVSPAEYVQMLDFSVRRPGDSIRTIRDVPAPPKELRALCRRVKALTPKGCVKLPLYCGPSE
jgi:hypothetical protein